LADEFALKVGADGGGPQVAGGRRAFLEMIGLPVRHTAMLNSRLPGS
jgi:hypothetical protein